MASLLALLGCGGPPSSASASASATHLLVGQGGAATAYLLADKSAATLVDTTSLTRGVALDGDETWMYFRDSATPPDATGGTGNGFYRYNTGTGAVEWVYATTSALYYGLAVTGDNLFLAYRDAAVRQISIATGTIVDSNFIDSIGASLVGVHAGSDDYIYAFTRSGKQIARRLADSSEAQESVVTLSASYGEPWNGVLAADGWLYVACSSATLPTIIRVDPSDGTVEDVSGFLFDGARALVVDDATGLIYVGGASRLHSYNPDTDTLSASFGSCEEGPIALATL